MQVYQGLHWPVEGTQTASSSSRADDCSVCLCSDLRTAAEIHASEALHGCPHLLPLLGMVNFSGESAAGGRMVNTAANQVTTVTDSWNCRRPPAVPHLEGYCTPRPHSNLDTYVHGYACGRVPGASCEPSTRTYCSPQHSVAQLTGIGMQLLQCLVGVQQRGLVHTGVFNCR